MNGFLNEYAALAYVAERQASLESAARRHRLVHEVKKSPRGGLDPRTVRDPRPSSRCATDLA
ncbi:hypothetical protein [Actinospica robiniae]|uniref:hypothetical protein n=1 Tax=Actinospica robiniae TaxID=304901 RepID=UPI0003F73E4B|nr:hypothetical protein [Actinospica robiniae]